MKSKKRDRPGGSDVIPPDSTRRTIGPAGRTQTALLLGLVVAWSAPTLAQAAPRLRCQLDQGGTTQVHEFAPVADPYGVESIDLNGRFRFKAVVIGDERQVQYIKLYTYYQTARRLVLVHAAKYLRPELPAGTSAMALTGQHYVYSPGKEREFQYACSLIEAAP